MQRDKTRIPNTFIKSFPQLLIAPLLLRATQAARVEMQVEVFEKRGGELVVLAVPLASVETLPGFDELWPVGDARLDLGVLGDTLVTELGLQGYAVVPASDRATVQAAVFQRVTPRR